MRVTIGEIVNELTEYSNIVETSSVHGIPFVRALIGGRDGITKCHMYVIQVSENTYMACDHNDDLFGSRCFPLGTIEQPFISENTMIRRWLRTGELENAREYNTVTNQISYATFLMYLYDRLHEYGITKFNPDNYHLIVSKLGFTNEKIIKAIENEFINKKFRDGTVADIITIVNPLNKPFVIEGVRQREIRCIAAKFRMLGIDTKISNNKIEHFVFQKK